MIHQIGLSYWPARLRIDSWSPWKVYKFGLRITTLVRRKFNCNSCNFPERCFFKSTDNCRRCTSLWIVSALKRRSEIPGNEELPAEKEILLYLHRQGDHRVHTEWQWPLSGVHSNMREKLAKASEGGGCTPIPFHYIYHHVQSCGVCSSWEGRYTPPFSTLPLYIYYVAWISVKYIRPNMWIRSVRVIRSVCLPLPQVATVRILYTINLASGFDPSILRHSGFWGAADGAVNKLYAQKSHISPHGKVNCQNIEEMTEKLC